MCIFLWQSTGFSSEWRFLPEHGVGLVVFSNRTYCSTGEANHAAMTHLLRQGIISPSLLLSFSPTLVLRSVQLLNCLQNNFEVSQVLLDDIFSSNFFLDQPKHLWIKSIQDNKTIQSIFNDDLSITNLEHVNHLRGSVMVTGKNGHHVKVFLTMTPENPPRIQEVKLTLVQQSEPAARPALT